MLTEFNQNSGDIILLNEEKVVPSFDQKEGVKVDKNMWYLDNGASNHMTGHREKFSELNESITGQVRFGDGSTVKIKEKVRLFLSVRMEKNIHLEMFILSPRCATTLYLWDNCQRMATRLY